MAGHTGSPPSKQLLRCVKQLELQKTFSRNSKSIIQGLCFAPSVSIPLNGCPHTRQSSAFTLLRRVHFQNPTFFGSKKQHLKTSSSSQNLVFFVPKILFFFFVPKNLVSSLRQALSLLYQNKMPCQAFPSSLLPEPKVKLFFIGKAYKQNQINCAKTPNCPQKLANQTSNPSCTPQRLADSQLETLRHF
ncbi:hypothetical protein AVEN_146096-1 [Araneus ventricosus]|uniref:Uncharacterized protein n=1 Tax=Araneus ventricosus TaxID=182803 RepID=A0A4Y2GPC2_ARAVE|nr:hypothetical protein AVEN_146096-1 [Araneus ventricosus]